MKVCCSEFGKLSGHYEGIEVSVSPVPKPDAQIEHSEATGKWNINGCCGGGCFVVYGVKFCPFCGADISTKPTVKEEQGQSS